MSLSSIAGEDIITNGEDNKLEFVAVHEIELKPGVNPEEFERFLLNDWLPPYNQLKGMNIYLTKGTRGTRNGKYAAIFTYDSIEDHHRIWPPSGEKSPEILEIRSREGRHLQWEKLQAMFVYMETFTDYEVVHRITEAEE